ncbi:hypothetical protein D3C73_1466160 [compost metagenome]
MVHLAVLLEFLWQVPLRVLRAMQEQSALKMRVACIHREIMPLQLLRSPLAVVVV